jgi:hypothetical protein
MKYMLLLSALLLITCEKTDAPNDEMVKLAGIPECIQVRIDEIKSEPVWNPPAEIYAYNYKGRTVYYIPQHCCDIPSELMDAQCNSICSPDGGISGGGDGRCADFFTTAKNGRLVWKDNR